MESRKTLADRSHDYLRKTLSDPETLGRFRYSRERIASLRRFVEECRADDRQLTVVIHPVHATLLESQRCAGLWDQQEQWTEDVVRTVDEASHGRTLVWDFTSHSGRIRPSPCSPRPRPALRPAPGSGSRRIARRSSASRFSRRIFNRPHADPDFGRLVTPETLADHLAQIRSERDAWLQTSAIEAGIVAKLARDAGFNTSIAVASNPSDRLKH